MCHNQIAKIAGTIPEHSETVPETFSPEFRSNETVNPRDEGGNSEKSEEYELILCRCPLQPRRPHRNNEIEADERVHKPQVPRHGRKVERQQLQVGKRLFPGHSSPRERQQGIEQEKAGHRREYAQKTPLVELPHTDSLFHRHQQKSRYYHKQRHGNPPAEPVVEGHPEAVAFVEQLGHIAGQPHGIFGSVKIFAGVDKHHKKAGNHPDIVHKDNVFTRSFSFHILMILCNSRKEQFNLTDAEGVGNAVVAASGADEIAQEGSGVESFSQVSGKGSYVGAFCAVYAYLGYGET